MGEVATFRYFAEPHAYSTYTPERHVCDSCGRNLPGYRGPFYGIRHVEFICEDCLVSGALLRLEQQTNDGDVTTLRRQLAVRRPDLSESGREKIVADRTDELEHRTPLIVTWQDLTWPAHCGDYCRFLKEAGKPDLEGLAAPGNGKSFFVKHLYEPVDTDLDYLWECVRPDSPKDGQDPYDLGVWLFQCLGCSDYVLLFDSS